MQIALYSNIGLCCLKCDPPLHKRCIEACANALAMDPSNIKCLYRRWVGITFDAMALCVVERKRSCGIWMDGLLKHNSFRAQAYYALKAYDKAKTDLKELLEKEKDDKNAARLLALCDKQISTQKRMEKKLYSKMFS